MSKGSGLFSDFDKKARGRSSLCVCVPFLNSPFPLSFAYLLDHMITIASSTYYGVVVHCFEDDDIVHANGKVDPKSDIDNREVRCLLALTVKQICKLPSNDESNFVIDGVEVANNDFDRSSPLVNHEDLGQNQAPKPLRVYYRKKLGKKNELAGMEGSVNKLSPVNHWEVKQLEGIANEESHGN
ncbi:hypothetical protein GH714_002701 [Hevea brasiliensis]|uniref:Uncharacterized protein n=1 Tax=Hevea brasiliensis TaxID=3981 RepID=A0A6A6MB61_HEVBR|nr:hypothetical protein GH714_002701 [Hevea brasiliensis]